MVPTRAGMAKGSQSFDSFSFFSYTDVMYTTSTTTSRRMYSIRDRYELAIVIVHGHRPFFSFYHLRNFVGAQQWKKSLAVDAQGHVHP